MVTKIEKFIRKLDPKQRALIEKIIYDIMIGKRKHYDHKALTGYQNLYRIRKGNIRIVFSLDHNGTGKIETIDYRGQAYQGL